MVAREVDLPPVWLAGFAALGAVANRIFPTELMGGHLVGGTLAAFALLLMVAAALQMALAGTSVIPGRDPKRLMTGGLFRLSRNPIYLADTLLLTGLFLYWHALIALPLVPLFMYLILKRFILPEEARLSRLFGESFEAYKRQTRRWI
ncbi:MAG: isoprenylcysteine carboxylmethyltransferase family protein [Proteobacteria bacterium]|nr:isoprenylcysteine carboxylmethyltransferase family protein [Pseudomonadota bacterium]MBS0574291.1 isoprenylcysteine carboxylmethyltransferase family protein [Pseudomonadota bacterium]